MRREMKSWSRGREIRRAIGDLKINYALGCNYKKYPKKGNN